MKNVDFISVGDFVRQNPQFNGNYKALFNAAMVLLVGFIVEVSIYLFRKDADESKLLMILLAVVFILVAILVSIRWHKIITEVEVTPSEYKIVRKGLYYGIYRFYGDNVTPIVHFTFSDVEKLSDRMYVLSKGKKKGLLYVADNTWTWVQKMGKYEIALTPQQTILVTKGETVVKEVSKIGAPISANDK